MPSWDLALYHSMLQHLSDTENEFNLVCVLLWTTQRVVPWDKHVRCATPELAGKGEYLNDNKPGVRLSLTSVFKAFPSSRNICYFRIYIHIFENCIVYIHVVSLFPAFVGALRVTSTSELVKNVKPFAGMCIMCAWVRTNKTVTH